MAHRIPSLTGVRALAAAAVCLTHAAFWTGNYTDDFDQVSEEVGRRFERAAVLACLETLSASQRQSLSIAYYGGRTYREVAEELGIALPTAKSRIRDGLIKLRGCLGVK